MPESTQPAGEYRLINILILPGSEPGFLPEVNLSKLVEVPGQVNTHLIRFLSAHGV
ncbi:MAG: hypothetical protein GY947_00530 [Rhodobacteraceae bacterium]|nr:hypothetical protein [Paracoccaceae bacterium]